MDAKEHFKALLGTTNPHGFTQADLSTIDLRIEPLGLDDQERVIIKTLDYLLSPVTPSGPEYLPRWEAGWASNLEALLATEDPATLIPAYITKNQVFRILGSYYSSPNPLFEIDLARIVLGHFSHEYFSELDTIVDVGSGSCHYIHWLATRLENTRFLALDWSSQSNCIAQYLGDLGFAIRGMRFDMFHPTPVELPKNRAGLMTVGALEQLGTNFEPMIGWIKECGFKVILNIEPIYEFYDQTRIYDFLPAVYLRRRNWLRGFLPRLRSMADSRQIEILEERRVFGSLHHETYNVIVWRFMHN